MDNFRRTTGGTPVVYNYGYDSVWKDKLVSFDGKSLTYDAIGNPLTIGDSVLTWIQGRKLSTFKKDATSETATYTYDENGIRRTKTVGNEFIEYITSGGEVVAERSNNGTPADSSDDVVITFTRGADGSLISMNRNGTVYYYVTNIQGDVEQILDSTGQVVVSYVYDAYGRVVDISGSMASTLGEENPFRYRSYYFDSESGYYYLQSRYYDPLMGRFISSDSQINPEVNGGNVFAYCGNNPVNRVDHNGKSWKSFFKKVIAETMNAIFGVMAVGDSINRTISILPAITYKIVKSKEEARVKKEKSKIKKPVMGDVTADFINKMNENVNLLKSKGPIEQYVTFANNVKTKGDWDYKRVYGYDTGYIFNGNLVAGEDLGNIHFGFVGASLGLSEDALLKIAGLYQIKSGTSDLKSLICANADDLRDQHAISEGYNLYINNQ